MKLSGFVLASVIGVGAVASACNAMSVEKQKQLCNQSGTKIWVKTTQTCVPLDACANSKYEKYCVRAYFDKAADLKGVDNNYIDNVREVLSLYVTMHYDWSGCDILTYGHSKSEDVDFIGCINNSSPDGAEHYLAFLMGRAHQGNSAFEGKCIAYNGTTSMLNGAPGTRVICEHISENQCNKIGGKYTIEYVAPDGLHVSETPKSGWREWEYCEAQMVG